MITNEVYRDRMKLCFNLMDTDQDGVIRAQDLTKCVEQVNMDSLFGRELQILVDHYSVTHLRIKTKPSINDAIDFEKYLTLL